MSLSTSTDTRSPRWDELWLLLNEQGSAERETRVILIHPDIAGGDKDHDGFDESGVMRVSELG